MSETIEKPEAEAVDLDRLVRRFKRNVSALNEVIEALRETYPDAGYYLANDTLCLMKGNSHSDGVNSRAQYENILAEKRLNRSGGGDW